MRCPLGVLEERERARKDRTLGQARAQFDVVHAGKIYDMEVDTSLWSAMECAQQTKERVEGGGAGGAAAIAQAASPAGV
ncbi:MAG: phosphotransferase-like protein [Anaerolineales bacterium]